MSIKLDHQPDSKVLTVKVSGKLEADDYERLGPVVEDLIEQHDKLDILLVLHDFKGWSAGALWEDLKFDVKHYSDIGKLAIVGDRDWEKGMAKFCRPFTKAEIKFFDREDLADAQRWIGVQQEQEREAPAGAGGAPAV